MADLAWGQMHELAYGQVNCGRIGLGPNRPASMLIPGNGEKLRTFTRQKATFLGIVDMVLSLKKVSYYKDLTFEMVCMFEGAKLTISLK